MTDLYADRSVYRNRVTARDLSFFRVTVEETDLVIGACRSFREEAESAVHEIRSLIEDAIRQRPEFLSSLVPLQPLGTEPAPVLRMLSASQTAGTGPMAAVAGTVAEYVGKRLLALSADVTVENGGDVFLAGMHSRTIGIAAGTSPLSMKLGIRVYPAGGIGVCTSSGTYGHSLSFGKADAAMIVAENAALSDAVATMLGNRCKCPEDLGPAVEWAAALPGVSGAVAIMGERVAAAGQIELTAL